MDLKENASRQILQQIHEAGVVRGYELIGRSRKADYTEKQVVEAVKELKKQGLIENEGEIYSPGGLMEAVISIHPRAYKIVGEELNKY